MIEIEVDSGAREQMVDVTARVEALVASSGVGEGDCHLFCPHTTCGLAVNEGYDPDVQGDILRHLAGLIPRRGDWRHAEGNSDAHLKAILTGSQLTVPVTSGKLRLGRWQALFLCEFDGPRTRRIWVTVR